MTCLIPLFVLLLSSTLSYAQSDKALVDRYDRMYESGRYELAYKTAEQIIKRYPESAWWQFQTGSVLARLDRTDEALEHLTKCADLGFSGVRSFEQSTDLDPLRELDAFIVIFGQVKGNAEKRIGEFQAEAKKHKPLVYVPKQSDDGQLPPLIIALHGTGMDGESMHNALLPTATEMGMALVSPDALRPAGNGFSWTYRDESEWFVEHLIERVGNEYPVDTDPVILVGFSQGANISLIMGQTHPEKFIGVVPICGHYEGELSAADQTPAPFYLLMGARDPWKRTYTKANKAFKVAGGAVQLRIITGRGHELPTGRSGLKEYKKALLWILDQEDASEG